MEPSPLEISNLRFRLRSLRNGQGGDSELQSVLDEIVTLKHHAAPLVPDLMDALKDGVLMPMAKLVEIITCLKSSELLAAAEAQHQGCGMLSTWDKCNLLRAGFLQFQPQLLGELFDCFERDDEPRRDEIVDALAKSGTESAIEMLKVIEYRTAARAAELSTEVNLSGSEAIFTQVMRGNHAGARKAFLEQVRAAIEAVKDRSDPMSDEPLPVECNVGIANGNIESLLRKNEGQDLEFKAALCADRDTGQKNETLTQSFFESVAAFANAEGGDILIGVENETKRRLGLDNDFTVLKFKDGPDQFERHLYDVISGRFGKVFTKRFIKISFSDGGNPLVCRVKVASSSDPVFLKCGAEKKFRVRRGNANDLFTNVELADYVRRRFPQV